LCNPYDVWWNLRLQKDLGWETALNNGGKMALAGYELGRDTGRNYVNAL